MKHNISEHKTFHWIEKKKVKGDYSNKEHFLEEEEEEKKKKMEVKYGREKWPNNLRKINIGVFGLENGKGSKIDKEKSNRRKTVKKDDLKVAEKRREKNYKHKIVCVCVCFCMCACVQEIDR